MVDLYSHFGIPNLFHTKEKTKIKIVIDPLKSYFDNNLNFDKKNYEKLILIHGCEPPLINDITEIILRHKDYFDKIYSFNEEVVNKCENSELFCFGSCWILKDINKKSCNFKSDYFNIFKIDDKKYKLSFIRSGKRWLPGHKLRYEVQDLLLEKHQFEILFPEMVIPENKYTLFTDSMFHLTIENSKVENYFTEKIIDCFMSYTIPIYWGCPNIGKYFNKNGIIFFETRDELNEKLKNLTKKDYFDRIDAIKENYEIAKNNYAFFFDRINDKINNI
jgi:hypothetical protein